MAIAEMPSPARVRQYSPGAFVQIVLPLLLLAALLVSIAAAVVYAVFWYLPRVGLGRDLVLRRLEEPTTFFGREVSGYVWLAILVPVLVIGLVYVIWMYVRDGVTIGWAWGAFLAALRCTVYAILALVFLLPALQAWETTTTESRVAVVFDVSGSMLFTRDEIPGPDTPLETLLTRQEKVLRFLNDDKAAFFPNLQKTNPVMAYRFGRGLDESYLVFDKKGQVWTSEAFEKYLQNPQAEDAPKPITSWGPDHWRDWLKPDLDPAVPDGLEETKRQELLKKIENLRRLVGATNLGTPLRKAFDREKNHLLQGFIVFTDGRNTEGSTDPLRSLIEDARRADPAVPIFVVAVGEERERVRIEITDLRVPEQIRPEDRFRATVDLTGEGLVGQKVKVSLDITRFNRKTEQPEGEIVLVETKLDGAPTGTEIGLGQRITLEKEAQFLPGTPPHAQVEYPLDAATLAKAAGKEINPNVKLEFKDDAESELRFVARVARDPREDFAQAEHKSDPSGVQVVKRPLRVLLVASGPMRDYHFLSVMLDREVRKGRAEMSICLQPVPGQDLPRTGRVQNVDPERLLIRFPDKMQDEKLDTPEEKHYNLSNYDVIVGFDPDWTRLSEAQLKLVEQWVSTHGGGLIVVGGPVNTLQLARPGAHKDKLKPMIDLYPVVLEDSRVQDVSRETDKPHRLNFPGATAEMEFLKIDEEDPKAPALQAWNEFFHGKKGLLDKPDPSPTSKVVPIRGFFNFYPVKEKKAGANVVATFADLAARMKDGQEQPYLVTQLLGSGKTIWMGSGEMWRLRQYKESYHERFWTKLIRYAGAGNLDRLNRRVILNMGRTFTANSPIQVEALIFGKDMKPLSQKARPEVTFKAPGGVEAPAGIKLEPKPSAGADWNGWFAGRFVVKTPGKYGLELKVPETDDTATGGFLVKEANPELDNTRPDFQTLQDLASDAKHVLGRVDEETARQLRERLPRRKPVVAPDTKKEKEAAAADEGALKLYFDLSNADLIPSCIKPQTKTSRNRGASSDLWDGGFTIWNREPPEEPVRMSTVLALVVGLFSIEWLTRKLLRLA